MNITAVCVTYMRPKLLAQSIRMFELQTHRDRELVVLDDTGQYDPVTRGDRWVVYSETNRYASLGAKRNAAAQMAHPDAEGLVVWDDDDVYLPWHIAAHSAALEGSEWSQPSIVYDEQNACQAFVTETFGWVGDKPNWLDVAYHGSWGYRTAMFWAAGGYPTGGPGDQGTVLGRNLGDEWGPGTDTVSSAFPLPSYRYCRYSSGSYHASEEASQTAPPSADLGGFSRVSIVPADPGRLFLPVDTDVAVPRAW